MMKILTHSISIPGSMKSLLVALLLLAGKLWASAGTDGVLMQLESDDLLVVDRGEKIYQNQCAACHGAALEGHPNWRQRDANGYLPAPPHDASGHTWHHADDLLFEITKYGPGAVINDPNYKSTMPAFENVLSDEEIIAVLSFIKNSWAEEERAWQDKVNGAETGGLRVFKKKSTLLDKLTK